jgi:hypothetical protein
LSTHLCLVLPNGLFPSGFPTNILYASSSHTYSLLYFYDYSVMGCDTLNSGRQIHYQCSGGTLCRSSGKYVETAGSCVILVPIRLHDTTSQNTAHHCENLKFHALFCFVFYTWPHNCLGHLQFEETQNFKQFMLAFLKQADPSGHALRCSLSSATRALGSWDCIPLVAQICLHFPVFMFSGKLLSGCTIGSFSQRAQLSMFSGIGRGLADPPFKESY